jgi:GH25 family lysozyme M1 (1,4-beta-N-acetylmuramidase)
VTGHTSVRRLSEASGTVLLSAAMAIGLAGVAYAAPAVPASPPVAATPAPISHPDADSLGSTIRLHEPADTTAPPAALGFKQLAVVAQPQGMDVSNYQANIDWAATKKLGAAFVYIKATENTTYQNAYFGQQYNGSYAAGLIRGAYHFALPDRSSGATQAAYFVKYGGGWSADGKTLPPMLDLEYNPYGATCFGLTSAQLVSWVRDFSNTVHTLTTRYPVIYTTADYWNTCTASNATFGATNPLFIARYASTVGVMPAGWGYQSIWQYNDHGIFPGDADVFNGSATQLIAFAGTPVVTPPPPPAPVDPITAYYSKLGGQAQLGTPIAAAYTVAGGQVRDFQNGTIYYSATTGTHLVQSAILARYRALGGPAGTLGFPLTDQLVASNGVGRYNDFSGKGGSSIYWSATTGAHAVQGAIRTHWTALGGPTGFLGYPITDETATRGVGGLYNGFAGAGGAITWTSALGAREIHGLIRQRWAALGSETGRLGWPTSDTYAIAGGGRGQNFVHGKVTWLPSTNLATATFK